jgi:hypothetical protein
MAVRDLSSRPSLVPRDPRETGAPAKLAGIHHLDSDRGDPRETGAPAKLAGIHHLDSDRGEPGSPADLAEARSASADVAEADRLIADLAALVDAGLVVVQPHVVGPARYGVAPDITDAA